jgi:hypothetical protein
MRSLFWRLLRRLWPKLVDGLMAEEFDHRLDNGQAVTLTTTPIVWVRGSRGFLIPSLTTYTANIGTTTSYTYTNYPGRLRGRD